MVALPKNLRVTNEFNLHSALEIAPYTVSSQDVSSYSEPLTAYNNISDKSACVWGVGVCWGGCGVSVCARWSTECDNMLVFVFGGYQGVGKVFSFASLCCCLFVGKLYSCNLGFLDWLFSL